MNNNTLERADMCFACGPKNPIGLKIEFTIDKMDQCIGFFIADENHVGYQNTVHGGIIYTALDDVMANVLYLQNIKAHTGKCEIRYRKPLEVGQKIKLIGKITSKKSRLITLKGEARLVLSNELIADCEAKFMLV